MTSIITGLQITMALAWAIPLVLFAPYAWRKTTGPFDTLRAAVWFVAMSNIFFPLRWIVFGSAIVHMPTNELAAWSGLYVLGIIAAGLVTFATVEVCRGR